MISVIIPVYNGEQYIDGLIGHFRRQGSTNFELVFVDDGSTDGTGEKLDSLLGREAFSVSVYHIPNGGVSAARNYGMSKANGEYIAFVDVDDFVSDDYIGLLESNLNGQDVLVFEQVRIYLDAEPDTAQPHGTGQIRMLKSAEILRLLISNPTRFGVYNLLIRRSFQESRQILFTLGYKYYEDYDFLYRLFGLCDRVTLLDRGIYYYMLRSGSVMNRFNADRVTCLALMEGLGSWFEEHVPAFAPVFQKWGASRVYWSVLWQACISMSRSDFLAFARMTGADRYLQLLRDYPDKKVRLSSRLWRISKDLFRCSALLLGGSHTKVEKVALRDLQLNISK